MVTAQELSVLIKFQMQGEKLIAEAQQRMGAMEKSAGGLSGAFKGVAGAAGGAVKALGAVGLAGMGISAVTGAAKGLGSALGLGLANQMEQTRASMMAFYKDAGQVEQVLAMVKKEAASTPFAFADIATAASQLGPVAKTAKVDLLSMIRVAESLSASNPMQGFEGAVFALKEAVSGDMTSIIERFNLSRSAIKEYRASGMTDLQAVQKAMADMGITYDLVAAKSQTMEGRWSTFLDTIDEVKMAIATPIFEALKTGLMTMQPLLEKALPTLKGLGTEIGEGLGAAVNKGIGFLTTFAGFIQTNWSTISAILGTGWDVLSTAASTAFGIVQTVIGGAVSFIQSVWPTVSGLLADGWDLIAPKVQGAASAIMSALGGAKDWITDQWSTVRGLVSDGWDAIGPKVGAAASAISEKLGEAKAWVTDNWPAVREAVADGWDTVGTKVGEAKDAITGRLGEAKDWITTNWPAVRDAIAGAFEDARPRVDTALDAIRKKSEDIASDIKGDWPPVQSAIAGAFEQARPAAERVFTFLREEGSRVVEFFKTEWPTIQTAASNVFDAIKLQVGTIVGPAAVAFLAIKAHWDQVGPALTGAVEAAWSRIELIIHGTVTGVLGVLKTVISFLAGDWSGAWDGAKQTVVGMGQILDGLTGGALSAAIKKLGEAAGAARDIFAPAVSGAAKLASDLASGIDSIAGAAGRVLGPIQALADKLGVLGKARGALDFVLPGSLPPLAQGFKDVGDMAKKTAPDLDHLTGSLDALGAADMTSTWAQGIGDMARYGATIRSMTSDMREWTSALLSVQSQLQNVEPYSAQEAALKSEQQIIQAEIAKRQTQIALIKDGIAARKEEASALAGFNTAQADATELGPLRGLTGLLNKAFSENTDASGAALFAGLDKVLEQGKKLALPNWAETGQALKDAAMTALTTFDPADADRLYAMMAEANGTIIAAQESQKAALEAAGTLNAQTLADATARAMQTDGIKNLIGSGGVAMLEGIDKAFADKTPATVAKVGELAAQMSSKLADLPEFLRGQLGTAFDSALKDYIANPTDDLRAKLVDTLGDINESFSLIPKGLDKMAPDVQAGIRAIVQSVVGEQMTLAQGMEAVAGLIESAKERAKDMADDAKALLDRVKADVAEARKFHEANNFQKEYPGPGGPGGGTPSTIAENAITPRGPSDEEQAKFSEMMWRFSNPQFNQGAAGSAGRSGGQPMVINLQIDGKTLTKVVIDEMGNQYAGTY